MNVAACADVKGLAAGVATAAAFSSGVVGFAAPPRRLSRSSRAPVPAAPWKMSGDVPVALGKPVARSSARCRAVAASAAAASRPDITLNEVLAQLAVKQLGESAPTASETPLPPFQSDVEARVEADAESDAEVSFSRAAPPRLAPRAGDAVRGIPPLPLPPKISAASRLAVVAVAPDAPAEPSPEHLGVPSTPGGQAAAAAFTLGARRLRRRRRRARVFHRTRLRRPARSVFRRDRRGVRVRRSAECVSSRVHPDVASGAGRGG